MKKIFIRSPYFIEIDTEIGGKVELYFYNKGESVPTDATYVLTKQRPSPAQTSLTFNIANYAKEFISPINPVSVTVPTAENANMFCYVLIKRYIQTESSYTLLGEETIVCLNGFSNYADGYNYNTTDAVVPMFNENINRQLFSGEYVNCYIDDFGGDTLQWINSDGDLDFEPNGNVYKLHLKEGNNRLYNDGDDIVYFDITANDVCEPKYTPMQCTFVNRYGGWEYLTFFKASYLSTDAKKEDYSLLPSSVDYNVLQGQRRSFNLQGKSKIKVNSGWVAENYFELIEDLMLSKTILLDNKPVTIKTSSMDKKQGVFDRVINYTIELDYNFGVINDVV